MKITKREKERHAFPLEMKKFQESRDISRILSIFSISRDKTHVPPLYRLYRRVYGKIIESQLGHYCYPVHVALNAILCIENIFREILEKHLPFLFGNTELNLSTTISSFRENREHSSDRSFSFPPSLPPTFPSFVLSFPRTNRKKIRGKIR